MTEIICTTELEAVNSMLAAIGEAPINTLTNPGLADAALAYSLLTDVCREVQNRGWQFNSESEFPLSMAPQPDGSIAIPTNVLQITVAPSWEAKVDLVWRGQKMYDRFNHTFNLITCNPAGAAIKFNIVWLLTFTDMPESARRYITVRAGRMFIDRTVGNETMHGFSKEDEETALAVLKQADGEDADYNILTGNYDVYRALDRLRTDAGMLINQ